MKILTAVDRVTEVMQAHVTARLGVLITTVVLGFMATLWIGAITYGRTFAQSQAIRLVRPVTDSLKTRQDRADSVASAIQDSLRQLRVSLEQNKRVGEITIAAQRQAIPGFDQALQEMALAGERAAQKEEENRLLIKRLTERKPNP